MLSWDESPVTEGELDTIEQIVKQVEPFAKRQDMRLSLEDIQDLRQLHLGLTPKQIRFSYYYVLLKNGPLAALKAGCVETDDRHVDHDTVRTANELLQKPLVMKLISALQLRAATTLVIDEHYVVHMAAVIAENYDYKPKDRLEALKLITKIRGFEAPVRIQHDSQRSVEVHGSSFEALHRMWDEHKKLKDADEAPIMDAEVEEME